LYGILLDNILQDGDQGWNFVLAGSPKDFLIDAEIFVHQNIANGLHLLLGKVRIPLLYFGWHGACSFAHGGELEGYCVRGAWIVQEIFETDLGCEFLDVAGTG
jgi:hypothetical protein